jgi:hypothetical protein
LDFRYVRRYAHLIIRQRQTQSLLKRQPGCQSTSRASAKARAYGNFDMVVYNHMVDAHGFVQKNAKGCHGGFSFWGGSTINENFNASNIILYSSYLSQDAPFDPKTAAPRANPSKVADGLACGGLVTDFEEA